MPDEEPTPKEPVKFSDPFPFAEVEYRVGATKQGDTTRGMAVAYINVRAAMNRMEDVCAANGWEWSSSYREVIAGKSDETHIECTIVVNKGNGVVISRADVGEGHDNDAKGKDTADPVKTAYSDAFKRAAVAYGIGRFLRDLPNTWVGLDEWRQITQEGYGALEGVFNEVMDNGPRPQSRRRGSPSKPAAPRPANAPAQTAARSTQGSEASGVAAPASVTPTPPVDGKMTTKDWDVFWGRTLAVGYANLDVVREAGVTRDVLMTWTRLQINTLWLRLKAKADGKVVTA